MRRRVCRNADRDHKIRPAPYTGRLIRQRKEDVMGKLPRIVRLAAAAVAAAVSAILSIAPAMAQTEKIVMRLDWNPWGSHAPFHLAQQKGWFKENGLEVEIQDGNGSVNTVQIVGGGGNF